MQFTKRVVLTAVVLTTLISVMLRYPLIEHERYEADSYFFHLLSQTIVDDGLAKWTLHPLSYVGYYPLSYPSGTPFLIGETSLLTGLSVEASILLMGMMLGILFVLAVFCLSREFVRRPGFVLLATILASLAPRYIDTTYWTGSARGTVAVLLVLSVYTLLRAYSTQRPRLIFVSIVFIIACFCFHHMAIFIVLFASGYLIVEFGQRYVFGRASRLRRVVVAGYFAGLAIVAAILPVQLYGVLLRAINAGFGGDYVFDFDPNLVSVLFNIGASYANQLGLVLIMSVPGVVFLFTRADITARSLYPFALVICFFPVVGQSLYVTMVIAPFVAVLGVFWLDRLDVLRRMKTKSVAAFLILLISSSVVLASLSVVLWNDNEYASGDTVRVGNQVFCDANYLTYNHDIGHITSNAQVVSSQISAVTGKPLLKSGIYSLLTGDIVAEDVIRETSWTTAPFPTNLYVWLQYDSDTRVNVAVSGLMIVGVRYAFGIGQTSVSGYEYLSGHSKLLVIIDNRWADSYVTDYGPQYARFPGELRDAAWAPDITDPEMRESLDSYRIYQSSLVSYYLVELPL